MSLGDGRTALFWEDKWINSRSVREIAPQLYACFPRRHRKLQTVSGRLQGNAWAHDIQGTMGIDEIGHYIQLWHAVEHFTLTTEPDRLLWNWTTDGSYSAKSCYQATFQGLIHSSSWKFIWKNWAPPRVRFFHWLADVDRCWTAWHAEGSNTTPLASFAASARRR